MSLLSLVNIYNLSIEYSLFPVYVKGLDICALVNNLRHRDDNCLGLARPDAMWVLLLKVKPSPFTSMLGPKSVPTRIDLTPVIIWYFKGF